MIKNILLYNQYHKKEKNIWINIQVMQAESFKATKKRINDIADQMEVHKKEQTQNYKKKYLALAHQIQSIAAVSDQCLNFIFENQTNNLSREGRDPDLLLTFYYQVINELLNYLKRQRQKSKKQNTQALRQLQFISLQKKPSNIQCPMLSSKTGVSNIANQNSVSTVVFEAMAKKNLQNYDLKKQCEQLSFKLGLAFKKIEISQQIVKKVQNQSARSSQFYRLHLLEAIKLLKKAQFSEIQLIQDKRSLTQSIQSIQFEFERYKKNFKEKPNINKLEQKIMRRLETVYDNKLQQRIKTLEIEYRNKVKQNRAISKTKML